MSNSADVAPVRERGLKYHIIATFNTTGIVAPVRERGLKFLQLTDCNQFPQRRSRKGAWIEIIRAGVTPLLPDVAPVRERGLKYRYVSHRQL